MKAKYIEFPELGSVITKEEELDCSNLSNMEVVIENETSVISAGTELARLNGKEVGSVFPFRPGYGSIGRIAATGSGIADFKIGDRVFYAGKHASAQRFIHGEPHQWGHLFPVPEDMDPVEAAMGCMAQIAMTGPNITELKLGDTVAVFGLGMVGILAAMMYQLMGARVIGIDPVKERCQLAQKAGIELVVWEDTVSSVLALTDGKGAQVAVDAVGHSAVICDCVKSVAEFGQIVLLGSPRAPMQADLTPVFWDIHLKGLVMRGAHMFRYPLHHERGCGLNVKWTFATVFELIKTRKLDVRPLISHIIPPEQAAQAYHGLEFDTTNYTGVVIDWS